MPIIDDSRFKASLVDILKDEPAYKRCKGRDDWENWSYAVAKYYSLEIERANPLAGEPATECLLQTPKWDFGWQRLYEYDTTVEEAVTARAGDTLRVTCRYNNTLENFQLLEALEEEGLTEPVDVGMGSNSLDEMCLGAFSMTYQL